MQLDPLKIALPKTFNEFFVANISQPTGDSGHNQTSGHNQVPCTRTAEQAVFRDMIWLDFKFENNST